MSEAIPTEDRARHQTVARRADAVVATLFMVLGLYIGFVSLTKHQAFGQGQFGPGVLPFLIGATLIFTSALILLRIRQGTAVEETAEMPTLPEASRAAALFALIVLAVVLIPLLGTLVSLGLFVLVETLVLERRGWRLSLAAAVAITALLYLFFEALLGVPLPAGMLGLL